MEDNSFLGSDGKRYYLSELQAGDMVQLRKRVQFQAYYDFQSFKGQLDPEEFNRASAQLLSECAKKDKRTVEVETEAAVKTFEGSMYLIYLALRRNHRDITFEDTTNIVTKDNIESITTLVNIMNGTAGQPSKKKTTKR